MYRAQTFDGSSGIYVYLTNEITRARCQSPTRNEWRRAALLSSIHTTSRHFSRRFTEKLVSRRHHEGTRIYSSIQNSHQSLDAICWVNVSADRRRQTMFVLLIKKYHNAWMMCVCCGCELTTGIADLPIFTAKVPSCRALKEEKHVNRRDLR